MNITGIILDLDGTVYHGNTPVPGAAEFVKTAAGRGRRCLFVTNRSNRTPGEVSAQLNSQDIPCSAGDVLTSSQAAAEFIGGGTVFLIGEPALRMALEEKGIKIVEENPDCVLVGFDRNFNYAVMKQACNMIINGAKFIATNPDRKLPTSGGFSPGTGAIVAAIEAGSGRKPVIVGKPEKHIFEMALRRLGMEKEHVAAVGDSLGTDVLAGQRAGIRTALLLTGISSRKDIIETGINPDWVCSNYDELAAVLLS